MKLTYYIRGSLIGSRRYVVDNNRNVSSRLIWLVFVLCGIGLALYQIQDRIYYYSLNPTSTNIEVVDVDELSFPQVTICNENRAKKSAADDYGMTCNIVKILLITTCVNIRVSKGLGRAR